MIASFLLASVIVFVMLGGWVLVQHQARRFAARHPEFGPAREEGGGCGSHCCCSRAGPCRRPSDPHAPPTH